MAIQQVMVTANVTHRVGDLSFRSASEILKQALAFQVPARNFFNRVQRWVRSLPEGTLSSDLLLSPRSIEAHKSFSTLHDIIEATAVLKHVMERDFAQDETRQEQLISLLKSHRKKLRKCRQSLHPVAKLSMPAPMLSMFDQVSEVISDLGLASEVMLMASPCEDKIDYFMYATLEGRRRRYLVVTLSAGVPYANVISRYTPPNRLVKGLCTTIPQLPAMCRQLILEEAV